MSKSKQQPQPQQPQTPAPANGKKDCPVTRQQFSDNAEPVVITIGGTTLTADPKEFSTGSLGWYLNGKVTLLVDGKPTKVQVGLNLTIVGSKELPK